MPDRHSIRLRKYDYSQARAYFITICTELKKPYFGKVIYDAVSLSDIGEIVRDCWCEIPAHYPHTAIEDYVIMPNHIHGIIRIIEQTDETVEQFGKANTGSIPAIIRAFKSITTKRKNVLVNTVSGSLWQRNYWERIIRNDTEYYNI